MNYKHRLLERRLCRLCEQFPIVIVSGARQVGKSTFLQKTLGWESVVFDPVQDIGNARQDPDLFLDNNPEPMILDEIQYVPELVAALKRRVDRGKRAGMYVLTGSQQWSVLQSASESLAGRAVFLDLEGFCLSEISQSIPEKSWLQRYLENPEVFVETPHAVLGTDHSLYEQLWRGFLPEVDQMEAEFVPDYFRAYLRTYIERDVRILGDVSDWQQFGRFVRLTSALTAQEVNHSQLGRDIGTTPQTAGRWLSMLRASFQWFEVPAYSGNTVKRISSKPKGYFGDTGLACNLQVVSGPRALGGHPLTGALFETAVASEIRKLGATLPAMPTMYHWRSHGGAEVDLLLHLDQKYYPIEIKLTTKPTARSTRGLRAFRETYPDLAIAPALVICPIETPQKLKKDILALPWNSL